MNVMLPEAGAEAASTGQPVFSMPVIRSSAWISCRWMFVVPIAPATNSVPVAASMTPVLSMPIGWTPPQPAPLSWGELPMFFIQTCAPVFSFSAKTSLPVVAAINRPVPLGPFCQ
jgi:hypothetical protein